MPFPGYHYAELSVGFPSYQDSPLAQLRPRRTCAKCEPEGKVLSPGVLASQYQAELRGTEASCRDGEKSEVRSEVLLPTAKSLTEMWGYIVCFSKLVGPGEGMSLVGLVNWSSFGLPAGLPEAEGTALTLRR